MTRYQLLLLPTVAAAIFVLGGALNQKKQPAQPLLGVSVASENDPDALAALDRAIAALAPERLPWLEAKVWQQVRCEDFAYQAAGRLLTAPGQRMRFDLNVQVGGTLGELRMVSDGQKLWQSLRAGGGEPTIQSWEMPVFSNKLSSQAELAQARTKLMHDQGFGGLAPMLQSLRQQVRSAQVVQQRWRDCEVSVIAAAWPESVPASTVAPDLAQARFQLRQCFIYLDAQTSWPHRIEWWGTDKPSQPNQLLIQTEFRSPILNQPLSAERCAGEFSFAGS